MQNIQKLTLIYCGLIICPIGKHSSFLDQADGGILRNGFAPFLRCYNGFNQLTQRIADYAVNQG